jgi:DNA (cytosine-5)-methyltransferase 1
MKLYEEILFLDKWFNGKYVVENVIPYYTPLIPAKKRGRHLYWTNFNLPSDLGERKGGIMEGKDEVTQWCKFHDYNFRQYKGKQSVQKMARNLVDYEVGKTIFDTMRGIQRANNTNQQLLF